MSSQKRLTFISALIWVGLLGSLTGCGLQSASTSVAVDRSAPDHHRSGVIYGTDSIHEAKSFFSNSELSVALMTQQSYQDLTLGPGVYSVAEVYGDFPELSWTQQSSAAFCSGVLIEPDLVLTAGHCVSSSESCENLVVVSGYQEDRAGDTPLKGVTCKKIERVVNDLHQRGLDYALVRLSEALTSKVELKLAETARVKQSLYILGYPLGSYKKIGRGWLRELQNSPSVYVAEIDQFEGNSGSPVFSAKDHKFIGIVSSGESDFIHDPDSSVPKIRYCRKGECQGEFITPIQKILADIRKQ